MWNRTWCGVEGGRWEVEARERRAKGNLRVRPRLQKVVCSPEG